MESLIAKYRSLRDGVETTFVRYLMQKINWKARAIRIEGARGTGKSTLMLQYIKEQLPVKNTLYLTLDDLYFRQHTLTEVAEEFYQLGGRYLFLDEVHKYQGWQTEVKNLYDFKKELQLVISGSSILALQKSSADLSRRVMEYHLPGLSFREYLSLLHGIDLPAYTFEEIIRDHESISGLIIKKVKALLAHYHHYIKYGVYPFFIEGEAAYLTKLNQLINVIIDYDLPEARAMEGASLARLKKLLYIISRSVPFTPNIHKLSVAVGTSRIRVLEMLDTLEKAQLIRNLRSDVKGISLMNKPDKIYLNNTNLVHALADEKPNKGNIRETLFLSHVQDAGLTVSYPKVGDFKVNEKYTFEVGGKEKTNVQIKGVKNAYIVADDIEYGFGNKIPLWLFGFLY
ncbi:MAG: AAA family ATPase [Flammeovirgaceae bacterium]|nr:MAG: AAA family ATPase [Flammeovirgaceae bacterium]